MNFLKDEVTMELPIAKPERLPRPEPDEVVAAIMREGDCIYEEARWLVAVISQATMVPEGDVYWLTKHECGRLGDIIRLIEPDEPGVVPADGAFGLLCAAILDSPERFVVIPDPTEGNKLGIKVESSAQ